MNHAMCMWKVKNSLTYSFFFVAFTTSQVFGGSYHPNELTSPMQLPISYLSPVHTRDECMPTPCDLGTSTFTYGSPSLV